MRLLIKIFAAPVVAVLALFVWTCSGLLYPELFTAIDSQKKSALTCFYHDISEEKLKPLSTKGRKSPLGYQLACFWDCQSSPVTGFIYSS